MNKFVYVNLNAHFYPEDRSYQVYLICAVIIIYLLAISRRSPEAETAAGRRKREKI